jgi:hypothetical protein
MLRLKIILETEFLFNILGDDIFPFFLRSLKILWGLNNWMLVGDKIISSQMNSCHHGGGGGLSPDKQQSINKSSL